VSPPPATAGVRDNPRLKLLRGNRFFLACDTETTDSHRTPGCCPWRSLNCCPTG